MSRRGNCNDNEPREPFFGHMKSFEEFNVILDNYIIFYNESRRQCNLKKMTPVEYRSHLIAA